MAAADNIREMPPLEMLQMMGVKHPERYLP